VDLGMDCMIWLRYGDLRMCSAVCGGIRAGVMSWKADTMSSQCWVLACIWFKSMRSSALGKSQGAVGVGHHEMA
jgi:hypothetical protein